MKKRYEAVLRKNTFCKKLVFIAFNVIAGLARGSAANGPLVQAVGFKGACYLHYAIGGVVEEALKPL